MKPKKILRILMISGMIVALGSLVLPSRFWQNILQAENIPPCDGKQLKALLIEARGAGNEDFAKDIEAYLAKYPNGNVNVRVTLTDGNSWASPSGSQGGLRLTVNKVVWAKAIARCAQPAPDMRPRLRDLTQPATPVWKDITEDKTRPARQDNSTVSSTTALRDGGWH